MVNVAVLEQMKERFEKRQESEPIRVSICAGTGCVASGSLDVMAQFESELEKHGLSGDVQTMDDGCNGRVGLKKSGCHGFCQMGPLVRIDPSDQLMVKVKPEDVPTIVEACLVGDGRAPEHNLYHHPQTEDVYLKAGDIPFYQKQNRVTLKDCGHIDPGDIEEYVASGGYYGLVKLLADYTPEAVCELIKESGMRGRGGGGFPTGMKWDFTRRAVGEKKYVVCNGDEGDPGAFMDRSIMEGDPHRLIEGMVIAAFAVGADEGLIYVRAEYPLAIARLRQAIEAARAQGILGKNILGSDFSFELRISKGAGAFVCGEETALMASIEGQRGMPTPKPPYPSDSGLFGCPTLINNVETLASIPSILAMGADAYRTLGTDNSPGTKTFAITGDIANTGLIEVPMGTPLEIIVFEIGGGIREGGEFKAVQIGGPSGGCLTSEHLTLPLDFDSLASVGAMIGSGGLVVMGASTCMVEVARFFMKFAQEESCGKCVLCREGTRRILEILERIVQGQGEMADLQRLWEIAPLIQAGSLCGLGKTAPNPVLTTLTYFNDEYEAHVIDKTCPAGVCQALKRFWIDPALCKGCSKCVRVCPASCIHGEIRKPYTIDELVCLKCGACVETCPFDAIKEVS